jgi:tetratricopeptide (TPR) repeat protein
MKHILILISTLFCALTTWAQEDQAQKYVEKEQYSKATTIYKKLLRSAPKKAGEYDYYLGDICLKKEKDDSAKYYFMEGIKVDETYALNYVGIGIVAMHKKNTTEGQRSFDKAIELSANKNVLVLNAIGAYFVNDASKEDLIKGITLLKKSTEIDSKNNAIGWMLLGDAYGKQSEGTKQIECYNKASTMDHSAPLLKLKYGKMYTAARNIDLAVKYFNEGLAIDATYGPLYRELGDVYNRFRKYDLAIQNYKKYLENIDRNDDVEFRYGYFLLKNENYAEAVEIFNGLESRNFDSPFIYNRRAVAYYGLGKYDLAKKDIETYFDKVKPSNTTSADYEYYGKILLKTGQDSLAILQMEHALDRDTTRLDLYGDIGSYYYAKSNYPKAIQFMSKQVTPTTKDPKIFYELGQAYYYNKEYVKADSSFIKVVSLKPNVYIGYLWRARSNASQDLDSKQGLAKPYYEKVIELCAVNGEKYSDELIESYEYIGYYYTIHRDKTKADTAWKSILSLDPKNRKALNGIKMK